MAVSYTGSSAPASSQQTLAKLWVDAGGPQNVANIMAAIAMAESGGRMDAIDHDSNGSTDYGLWQINSVHGYDPTQLLNNALYNAKAAVAVFKSQGLGAWVTYNTGAYLAYLPGASRATVKNGVTRPGGDTSGTESSVAALLDAYQSSLARPDPSTIVTTASMGPIATLTAQVQGAVTRKQAEQAISDSGIGGAINSTVDFLGFVAWFFSPENMLRVVEFLTGAGLMVLGLHMSVQNYREARGAGPAMPRRSLAARLAGRTPPVKAAQRVRRNRDARALGRSDQQRSAQAVEHQRNYKAGRSKEIRRQAKASERKNLRRSRRTEKPPF
jgi:hypothetical protein